MRSEAFHVIEVALDFDTLMSIGDPVNYDVEGAYKAHTDGKDDPDKSPPDTPVVRDPRDGSPMIQGTSLMGALRHHLSTFKLHQEYFRSIILTDTGARTGHGNQREVPPTLAHLVCGSLPEERAVAAHEGAAGGRPALRPSALRLVQIVPQIAAQTNAGHSGPISKGTRVAISRRTGAAVDNKLFTQEQAQFTGATVLLTLDHDVLRDSWLDLRCDGADFAADEALSAIVAAVQAWPTQLGAHASTGRGVATVAEIRTRNVDMSTDLAKLLSSRTTQEFLRNGLAPWKGSPTPEWVVTPASTVARVLQVTFRLVDPLFIDPHDVKGGERDNTSESSSVIAGSAWKGVLRSRCEYILRSVGVDACLSSDGGTCGRCPTCRLFGWTPNEALQSRALESLDGARSMLRFADSRVHGGVPPKAQAGVQWLDVDHVAINRFTGGAEDRKLFVERAIAPPAWVELTVDTNTGHPEPSWATPLLWLAIRDIHDGLVGIGHSTTRGMGTLALGDEDARLMAEALLKWPVALAAIREEFTEGSVT